MIQECKALSAMAARHGRAIGTGLAGTGISVAWLIHPQFGAAVTYTTLGLVVFAVVLVLGLALLGSPTKVEDAYRFLRWLRNAPEPQEPASARELRRELSRLTASAKSGNAPDL